MEESKAIWMKKAPVTIVGVLVVGIVCSAIYDIFVKPGINGISELIFNVVTLGSQKIKDYAFNNAALDPTALPSLILLTGICGVIAGIAISKILKIFKSKKHEHDSYSRSYRSSSVSYFLTAYIFAATIFAFIYITMQNQSIIIWRVFHANMQIVSPFIEENERLLLFSKFSGMSRQSDYEIIKNELSIIAKKNNIKLRTEETW